MKETYDSDRLFWRLSQNTNHAVREKRREEGLNILHPQSIPRISAFWTFSAGGCCSGKLLPRQDAGAAVIKNARDGAGHEAGEGSRQQRPRTYGGKVSTLSRPDLSQQPGRPAYVLYMAGDPEQNSIYPNPYGYYGV